MMAQYELSAHKTEAAVLQYHGKLDWTPMKPIKGTKIWYRKSPQFSGTLYKFEYDMDIPDDVVYSVMKPPLSTEERLAWDKSIQHFECLLNIPDEMMIGLILTHSAAAGMISSREFVDLYYFKQHVDIKEGDCDRISWIFAESIKYPDRPETSDYVRAWNYPTGYAVSRYRNNPAKCKLTLYINVDIGGRIPRYIVERAIPSQQVTYIESIQRQARKVLSHGE